jgi:hypothetical protein
MAASRNLSPQYLDVTLELWGIGAMSPPPPTFLKVKKCPFFWAKVSHLKNEKSIS